MSQPQLRPNARQIRTPSKVPLPSPLSRFSTIIVSSPLSSDVSSPLNKPLPSPPAPAPVSNTSRKQMTPASNLTNKPQSIPTRTPRNSLSTPSKKYSYVSVDGSHYGPTLSISKDADRLILGNSSSPCLPSNPIDRSKSKSKSNAKVPPPPPPPSPVQTSLNPQKTWLARDAEKKPLPTPPKTSSLPRPLYAIKNPTTSAPNSSGSGSRLRPRTKDKSGNTPVNANALVLATQTATDLLDRALATGRPPGAQTHAQTEAQTEAQEKAIKAKKERLITVAQSLVDAIVAARDAEITVLKAEEAQAEAGVRAVEARAACAAAKSVALEKTRGAWAFQ